MEKAIDLADTFSFEAYLYQYNRPGSNKADSYLRALELLTPILKAKGGEFSRDPDILSIRDPAHIRRLYQFILKQQKLGEKGIFAGELPASYWRDGYYSAALGNYEQYLNLPEQKVVSNALNLFQQTPTEAAIEQFSRLDQDQDFEELLKRALPDDSQGREALRLQKTRVNQGTFRRITLLNYQNACCLTGLNIPTLLRASHIIPWAESPEHRMKLSNGLCLAATYDAAFDKNLISFDDQLRLVLSPTLREHHTNEAFMEQFQRLEGKTLKTPVFMGPGLEFLREHRDRLRT